jgi:hypothetical protein
MVAEDRVQLLALGGLFAVLNLRVLLTEPVYIGQRVYVKKLRISVAVRIELLTLAFQIVIPCSEHGCIGRIWY